MKGLIKPILIYWLALTSFTGVSAQDGIKQLEEEKDHLETEIQFTKSQISKIRTKQVSSLLELTTLKKQLAIRQSLISNIKLQLEALDTEIDESQAIVKSLKEDLVILKDSYAKMVYQSYTTHFPEDNLYFVFAASSFNEAFKRIKYLKKYGSFKKMQVSLIHKTMESIQSKIEELEVNRLKKSSLLLDMQGQKNALDEDKKVISDKITSLNIDESKLLKEVEEKEKAAKKLNKQIEKMIAEAREKALKASSESSSEPSLTPEALELSNQFSGNKGKLPWPIFKGTIIRGFGKKLHPVLRNPPVYITNNGVDISTEENAEVRSIFNGQVVTIFFSPVFQKAVIVMHGEYFTVYSQLKEVLVKEGDKVTTKQPIGIVWTDNKTTASEIHLEIWKGTTLLNPSLWLYK